MFYGSNSRIIFAAGFLLKENIASFVWLFNAFKDCMGKAPATIITDQDSMIKATLEVVFPSLFHKLCKWHVTNKSDRIGRVFQNKYAMDDFFLLIE